MSQHSMNTVATYKGRIAAKSKAAILFVIVPEGEKYAREKEAEYHQHWFPLSQIKKITEGFSVVNETLDTLVVTEWIAVKKGLIKS